MQVKLQEKRLRHIIVSRGNLDRFHVAPLLHGVVAHGGCVDIVVHTDEQRDALLKAEILPAWHCRVHVSNVKPPHVMLGCAMQREWAEANLTYEGEWYVTLDDNVQLLRGLKRTFWPQGRDFLEEKEAYAIGKAMYDPLPFEEVIRRERDLITRCIVMGAVCGGFAVGDCVRFVMRHYREIGYCNPRWSVQKSSKAHPWRAWPDLSDEGGVRSVLSVATTGAAPIDNWTSCYKKPWEAGGIGGLATREPFLKHDRDELMARGYGWLVTPQYDHPQGMLVRYRKTSQAQVLEYLKEHPSA